MLGRAVGAALRKRPPASVWSPALRERLLRCDAVVCNLECCVSARGTPTLRIPGKPFFFRAPPTALDSLRAVGARVASLANNHALDFEADALADTVAGLASAGIAAVGAGPGEAEARRGVVVETRDAKIGVFAVADHPAAYAAQDDAWGTAYADLEPRLPTWCRDELGRLAAEADCVLAFPHWGPNMTVAPAAWQRRRAREMLAAGASLVAGHSAHVFHGVERHEQGWAAYDLGGAVDDYAVDPVLRNDRGLLALWRPFDTPALELIGLQLELARTGIAHGEAADWIADRLTRACAALGARIERSGESSFIVQPPPSR